MLDPTPHQHNRASAINRRARQELEGVIAYLHPPAPPAPPCDYGMTADYLEAYATRLANADDPAVAALSGYPRFAVPTAWQPWELAARFGIERRAARAAAPARR